MTGFFQFNELPTMPLSVALAVRVVVVVVWVVVVVVWVVVRVVAGPERAGIRSSRQSRPERERGSYSREKEPESGGWNVCWFTGSCFSCRTRGVVQGLFRRYHGVVTHESFHELDVI